MLSNNIQYYSGHNTILNSTAPNYIQLQYIMLQTAHYDTLYYLFWLATPNYAILQDTVLDIAVHYTILRSTVPNFILHYNILYYTKLY